MKILVISDSHGRVLNVKDAYTKERPDGICFLGDGLADLNALDIPPTVFCAAVKGNCDFLPEENTREFWLENKKILLTHGHSHGVKQGLWKLDYSAREKNADIILYGHTHQVMETDIEGKKYICPGSIAQGSYVVLWLSENQVKVEFKELY